MSSKNLVKRQMQESPDEFADLYRDIRGQFTKGKPLLVVLRQLRLHGGDTDVEKWHGDYFDGLDPNEFTQTVVTAITDDARIFPGMVRYGVFFYRKNTNTHDARVLLNVEGGSKSEDTGDVFGGEGSDDKARAFQIMRHDEAYTRLAIGALTTTMTSKDQQLARSEAMVERLLTAHVEVLDRVQILMDRTAERDLRLERSRKMYELMDEGIEKIGAFAPFLIAAKIEEKNPQLAAMIRQSAANPANDIVKILIKELESNPEKAQEILAHVMQLPNGAAIVQALAQMKEIEKATAARPNGAKS